MDGSFSTTNMVYSLADVGIYRNNIRHTTHSTIEETTNINQVIHTELTTRRLDGLPGDYTHLFRIKLDQLRKQFF